MVEGVDLERLYGFKIIEGSNPSLSENLNATINCPNWSSLFWFLVGKDYFYLELDQNFHENILTVLLTRLIANRKKIKKTQNKVERKENYSYYSFRRNF